MKYIILAFTWALYGAFHSTLLSHRVKNRLTRWELVDCHWRFFFAMISAVTLIPPVWLTYTTNGPWIVVWPWKWPLVIINGGALVIGWMAMKSFGGGLAFLGIDRLFGECELPRPEKPIQKGILGWVRHPLYALTIIFLWAHDLNAAGLVTSGVLTIYVFVGTHLEEKRLEAEWGDGWIEYRRNVSAFFPLKKFMKS